MHEEQVIHTAMVQKGEALASVYWDLGPSQRKNLFRSRFRRQSQPLNADVIIAREKAAHDGDTTLPRAA